MRDGGRPRPRSCGRSRGGRRRGRRRRRPPRGPAAEHRGPRPRARVSRPSPINGRVTPCDLLVMSGSPQPNYKLLAQAGARVVYDERARRLRARPTCPRTSRRSAPRRATSASRPCRSPVLGYQGDKCFVCFCEDQTTKDLKYAIAEGFDSIELVQAVHDGDDGAVPGAALPRQLDPRLREGDGARREHDRDDDRAAAALAGHARPPRRAARRSRSSGRRCTTATRSSARTMMWTGAWKRPHSYGPDAGCGGAARPRRRRSDRRLDARQDPRHRPRRGRVPRPRLPEPLLRPEGRPHPLRRAHRRRGPDHGRRHRRPPRRRDVLRDDDLDRRGRASTSGSRGGTRSGRWTSGSSS